VDITKVCKGYKKKYMRVNLSEQHFHKDVLLQSERREKSTFRLQRKKNTKLLHQDDNSTVAL
jgi:hypothetical protein